MKFILTSSVVILLLNVGIAQVPKIQLGVETGNNIVFSNIGALDLVKGQALVRYSCGVVLRHNFKKGNKKLNYFKAARKNGISVDYGINLDFSGYDYKIGNIETSEDRLIIEVPILLVFKFTDEIWMSRKMRRNGMGTYLRIGIKNSWMPSRTLEKTIVVADERVDESTSSGGFDIGYHYGFGISKAYKDGRHVAFGMNFNYNFLKKTNINIQYIDNLRQIERSYDISTRRLYFSLNMIYLFDVKRFRIGKEVAPPRVYNPRFL